VRDPERITRRPGVVLVAGIALLAACAAAPSVAAGPAPTPGTVSTAAGCASAPPPQPGTQAGSQDWPTYHRSNDRSGFAPATACTTSLSKAWDAALDGAVYGQPLVLGDLVVAATENDSVYGLALADGSIRWHTTVGTPVPRSQLPCGNIDPLGITGTPAYDGSTGSVFVAAETGGAHHDLVALDPVTGAVRWRAGLDVTSRDRAAEQQRGALAVANGLVYVPFGGLAGDCANYVGYVTATPTGGQGTTTHYEVPTSREGGMWAPSGVAVDEAGDVWVAVGNGESTGVPYDGSDSVLRLSPDLSRRLDFFAPQNWGQENAADADLGSTGPLLLDRSRVLISGKTGDVYLLDATRLGGIGGQVARIGDCRGFGGMAWDEAQQAAFVPCDSGLLRVDVGARSLRAGWRASDAVTGSPIISGGAVFALDRSGAVHLLAEDTGRELATAQVGPVNRFASPVRSGTRLLVPTLAGISALTLR